ncbi:hypothetical protein HPP92_029030 [Vanilla planifolia]|uniref:Uncharacterized protein n=1 Tax=Vanilla planifolia TaxID=51239 RepID=A0A835U1J6_VANPL|nr:hypothetical protein HPP92_029030 [Vanilla planifolia]
MVGVSRKATKRTKMAYKKILNHLLLKPRTGLVKMECNMRADVGGFFATQNLSFWCVGTSLKVTTTPFRALMLIMTLREGSPVFG